MISLVLTNLMYLIVVHFAATKIFEKKQSIKSQILILAAGTGIISIFNGYGPSHYGAIVFFLIIVLTIFFCYRVSIMDSILYSFFQFINIAMSEFISMFVLGIGDSTNVTSLKYFIGLVVSTMISFLLSYAIIWIFKEKKKYKELPFLPIIFVLPLVTIILIMNIKDYFVLVNSYPRILIVIIGLFLSNLIILVLFFRILDAIKLQHQLEAEQYKSRTQKEHIKLLNEQYKNNFDYLHDLLHNIQSISENIRDNETKDKLEELSKTIDFHFNSILTNSLSLNSAINKLVAELEKNEIVLRTTVYDTISYLDFESQVDLFVVLLEKGIESCRKRDIQNRVLIIQIMKKKNLEIVKFVIPNVENNLHENLESFFKSNNISYEILKFIDDNTTSFVISLEQ